MILIGQYDSPFVRRVGVVLTLDDLPFEHRPWSVFSDAETIRRYNPLVRVPILLLPDGEVLIETYAIVDHLDGLAPAGKPLWPDAGPERRRAMQVVALASGLSDKAVGLFYEIRLHDRPSDVFVERWRGQMLGTLAALEADRASRPGPCWFGERIGHADIAVATSLRHATESHPGLIRLADYPALAAHCARLEALPVFKAISQPFIPPAA